MAKRRDERLVAGDEIRARPNRAAAHGHGAFVITLEGVRNRVELLEPETGWLSSVRVRMRA